MLCDVFARLVRIDRISGYRYVGFGSLSFADFALFYRRLGFQEMVSIERREDAKVRFEFNLPYSCISMAWGEATDKLREIDWTDKRSVVWLDYDSHLNRDMLGDLSHVMAQVRSGSIVAITVCADPGEGAGTDAPQRRFDKLSNRIGNDRLPPGLKPGDLSKWGLARVCRDVINDAIERTLNDRNGPLAPEVRLQYRQLFNFHYSDGARMLTVGGIVFDEDDAASFGSGALADFDFVRANGDPYLIESPVLTWRETTYLDKVLSESEPTPSELDWLPQDERERYERIARYSPTYIEAEL